MLYITSPELIYDWKFVPFDHQPQPLATTEEFPEAITESVERRLEGISRQEEKKMARDQGPGEGSYLGQKHKEGGVRKVGEAGKGTIKEVKREKGL